MKTNTKPPRAASSVSELRRAVLSCLLWEDQFYESGIAIADRIKALAATAHPQEVARLAVEARHEHGLRHVPLLLLCCLAERRKLTKELVFLCMQRADEPGELLALWWKDGRRPIPNAMRKGIAMALCASFDEYQLAKYANAGGIKLRDVLFLIRPKPTSPEQAELFRKLANKELSPPDTWEAALAAGKDKKETFERLLTEGKIGYMALLRNLRNMSNADVDHSLVAKAIVARRGSKNVMPFRYVAAAKACPRYSAEIDTALRLTVQEQPILAGRTIVLVDVSGSMRERLSAKSDLTRLDAAAALASVVNCEDLRVFTFSSRLVEVSTLRGLGGIKEVVDSQPHANTNLDAAMAEINEIPHDRLIVITDEQTDGPVRAPVAENSYLINVASYEKCLDRKDGWTRISGFSEGVLRFIQESE